MNDYEILGLSSKCILIEVDMKYQEEIQNIYSLIGGTTSKEELSRAYYKLFSIYNAYNNIVKEQRRNPLKNEINTFVIYSSFSEIVSDLINFINYMAYVELSGKSMPLQNMRKLLLNIIDYIYSTTNRLKMCNSLKEIEDIEHIYEEDTDKILYVFKKEFLSIIKDMFPNVSSTKEGIMLVKKLKSLSSFNVIPFFLNNNIDFIGDLLMGDIILNEENEYFDIRKEHFKIKDDYDKSIKEYLEENDMDIESYIEEYGNNKYSEGLREYFKDRGINNYDVPSI